MSESAPSRWSNLRESCTALRELLIVTAMLALLFAPSSVRSVLERAGVRSVAGVEFDATTLNESRDEMLAAQAQVDELKKELAMAQQQFSQIAASTGNTRNPRFTEVSEMLAQSRQKLEATEGSLGRSRIKQERVLNQYSANDGSEPVPQVNTTQSFVPSTAERVLMPPSDLFDR